MVRWIRAFGVGMAGCIGVSAYAGCPTGQEAFTSCRIDGRAKEVLVCFDQEVVTYRYGPIDGPPELTLSSPIAQVDYEPWSGLGTSISESVTFYNGLYSYEVVGGFERPFTDPQEDAVVEKFGWLDVGHDGDLMVRLDCDPDTVSYGYGGGLFDVKVAAGQEWDDRTRTWMSQEPVGAPVLRADPLAPNGRACLPAAEFSLGGVRMGDTLAELGKLGSPEPSGVFTFRGQEINRMALGGLEVDMLDGEVMRMTASSALWNMPSGVRVGMTRGDVVRRWGDMQNGRLPDGAPLSALVCLAPGETSAKWHAVVTFGPDNRVANIRLEGSPP